MNVLKIGIVEDDLIIADAITEMLQESGYQVAGPAMRYSEAITMIEQEAPDLVLLDVRIAGRLDGIDVAQTINRSFAIPYIFLTANTDFDTISRAKAVAPAAFLAKPITQAQLYAAIEIAAASWNKSVALAAATPQAGPAPGYIFIKDGHSFRRVACSDIIYAQSEQNYIRLYLTDGTRPVLRGTVATFEEQAAACGLIRVHRSFLVQPARIERVLPAEIMVAGTTIPVSRSYRAELERRLGLG